MSKANNPVFITEVPELAVGDAIEHRRYGGYAPEQNPYHFTITGLTVNEFTGAPLVLTSIGQTFTLHELNLRLSAGQFVKV